jgi:diacylglycerol kinase family enzyme
MKKAQIVHNPAAGDGRHSKKAVTEIVKKAGYEADYLSTKKKDVWKDFRPHELDAVFVAGGDGTVHKLVEAILTVMPDRPIPIHLIPRGTANNIAKTLQITTDNGNVKKVDYGRVLGLHKKHFFFESTGFGIFPELIFEMERNAEKAVPHQKLKQALGELQEIVKKIKPVKASIKADGFTIKGSFLLVEVMNIQFLGPNLHIAPKANPGDGYFDLVLIYEKHRSEFLEFITENLYSSAKSLNLDNFVTTYRAQKVEMVCEPTKLHIDDHLLENYSGHTLGIELVPGTLEFVQNI